MPVIDHADEVREAVIEHLKATAGIKALVGGRVHDEPKTNPKWPFIRYGTPISGGFEATCWDGSEHRITLHGFAKGPGRKPAQTLAKAIVAAMEAFSPTTLGIVSLEWIGSQVQPDPAEKSAYHAIVEYEVVTAQPY